MSCRGSLTLRRLTEPAAEVVELVEIPEGDADLAALPAVPNGHLRAERQRKLLLERARVGVDRGSALPRTGRLAGILAQAFDVPDRQAFGDDPVGERVRVGDGEQGARVSGGNLSAREQAARVLGQIGQAKRVCDVAPAFADHTRDVAVRIAVIGAKMGVAGGLFEGVPGGVDEVFALTAPQLVAGDGTGNETILG